MNGPPLKGGSSTVHVAGIPNVSSGVAQLNLNSDTIYRKPAFRGRVTASLTQTEKDDGSGRDDRGSLEISYLRYPWQEWFVLAASRFETNESLGLKLRSQLADARS